jgi:urease accessory protein UreF
MGGAALVTLFYTGGDVHTLIVMYSINVFVTFSLSNLGMCRHWWRQQNVEKALRIRRLVLFGIGLATCGSILGVTVWEKFSYGGWITIAATAVIFTLCLAIRAHYANVGHRLLDLYQSLEVPPPAVAKPDLGEPDPKQPVAVVLVAAYRGPGIHTTLNVFKMFPGHFKGLIFCSVAVLDSGDFKGEAAIAGLQARSEEQLKRYRVLANGLGMPSAYRLALGTDAVEESVKLCRKIREQYPKATFFAGKVLFERDTLIHMLLHNDTAFAIQRRLQWDGLTTVVVPARCRW